MSDEVACDHEWGPAELVELGVGEVFSPLCVHCGAVKLQVQEQASRRARENIAARWINRPPASGFAN